MDKMLWNMYQTQSIRCSAIKRVKMYKPVDSNVWLVGAVCNDEGSEGGWFNFGTYKKESEAKKKVQEITEAINSN